MLLPFVLSTLLLTALPAVDSANILALLTTACKSHHLWNSSLMRALAARGHHLTVLSPDRELSDDPNLTYILLEDAYDVVKDNYDYGTFSDDTSVQQINMIFNWGQTMCRHNILTNGTKQLFTSQQKFDLVIVEITSEECFLGFVEKFGAPVMGITAWGHPPWANYITGNPDNPSYIPNILVPLTDRMSFMERWYNLLLHGYTMMYRRVFHMREMDEIARGFFGQGSEPVSEIEKRISVVLVNTSPGMDYPQQLLPGIVPVGGLHIRPVEQLPGDLQQFLDDAPQGVVFFSLGSNVRSDRMSPEKIQAFLDAFRELPQRVLWKWESDVIPTGLPVNVKLEKWLPQNDVLGHPNVVLFLTHGGLLSTQEAIYHAVPIVGMPFMLDQHINIEKAVSRGAGEKLVYSSVTMEIILKTIRRVINTPSYRVKMRHLSAVFRDQMGSPLERAVFWVEYAAAHEGGQHMRSAANDLTWYQYLLLDVIVVLIAAVGVGIAAVVVAIRLFRRAYSFMATSTAKRKQQ